MIDSASYHPDHMEVNLAGPLTRQVGLALQQEIGLGLRYYHYTRVELIVDSPGGELVALEQLVSKLDYWRQEYGLVLITHVAGEAASAAGILAAMGTIGHRTTAARSRILLHEPRISIAEGMAGQHWTGGQLAQASEVLDRANNLLLDAVCEHVWNGAAEAGVLTLHLPGGEQAVRVRDQNALRRIYADMLQRERWLTPQEAVGLALLDRVEGTGWFPRTKVSQDPIHVP